MALSQNTEKEAQLQQEQVLQNEIKRLQNQLELEAQEHERRQQEMRQELKVTSASPSSAAPVGVSPIPQSKLEKQVAKHKKRANDLEQ